LEKAMTENEYPACINELYQSEVLGEQAFLALMAVARNEREKYHFGTFLQLESETKVRLRPLLQRYDLDLVENLDSSEQISGFVALYEQSSWPDFLSALKPMIEQFLARFKEIADAGAAQDQLILDSMITHEESFIHWIDKELAGEEGSLDAAIIQLQHPLAAP
jgi:hypothetical protein